MRAKQNLNMFKSEWKEEAKTFNKIDNQAFANYHENRFLSSKVGVKTLRTKSWSCCNCTLKLHSSLLRWQQSGCGGWRHTWADKELRVQTQIHACGTRSRLQPDWRWKHSHGWRSPSSGLAESGAWGFPVPCFQLVTLKTVNGVSAPAKLIVT